MLSALTGNSPANGSHLFIGQVFTADLFCARPGDCAHSAFMLVGNQARTKFVLDCGGSDGKVGKR
jgi:hypothetical protein